MQRLSQVILLLGICLQLGACGENTTPAPVIDINALNTAPVQPVIRTARINTYSLPNRPIRLTQAQALPRATVQPYPNYTYETKLEWLWPAEGRVINKFSPSNKGIDIVAKEGSPVYAATAGRVAYSGNGLRGYGNLIILKHDNLYLSAYAYNRKILVKEGQFVRKGQIIAEMGHTGLGKTMLHFEIRRASQPIDPLTVLK